MLLYNFNRILKARGVERPFSFLRKAGFSDNFATKVKRNDIRRLNLDHMERLCMALRCTPNDFMEWIPDDISSVEKDHPLNKLRKTDKIIDVSKLLNSLPLDKLEDIERVIQEEIAKNA